MKECQKCKKSHNNNGKFCSRSCANSRTWTDEDKLKKSESAKKSEKVILNNQNKSKEIYSKIAETKKKKHKEKILNSEYSELSFESLRFRILYEQDCKCNRCGLNEWLGVDIPLELEHKDGNHYNDSRDNLEALCPNCHSQTPTFRGRNIKNKVKRSMISDDELLSAMISNNFNMRQSLIEVGLTPKGANYNRCHKLKRLYLSE